MTDKVLIVDDSPFIRMMIRRALRQAEVPAERICEAGNGQEALDRVNDQAISTILLDLNMPVMDGESFLRTLRKTKPEFDPCVVVVSTEANTSRIMGLRGLGISGFLSKPFETEKLKELLSKRIEVIAKVENAKEQPQIDATELDQAITSTLEMMAFVLADPADDELPLDALHSGIEFDGAGLHGRLRVSASEGFAREAAAGMTGLEEQSFDPESLARVLDELANIIAGRVIKLLGGESLPFRLGLPEKVQSGTSEPCIRRFSSMGEGIEIGLCLESVS